MPNISAMPSEIAETGSATKPPGRMIASCLGCTAIARVKNSFMLKPNAASTRNAITEAPRRSRPALMICTQVVATMPPKVTYRIISTPTITTASE